MCRFGVRAHQQAVVISWSQVGVAEVAGRLEHSHDALHVAGQTEAVVSNDQQLHNYRGSRNSGEWAWPAQIGSVSVSVSILLQLRSLRGTALKFSSSFSPTRLGSSHSLMSCIKESPPSDSLKTCLSAADTPAHTRWWSVKEGEEAAVSLWAVFSPGGGSCPDCSSACSTAEETSWATESAGKA